jgi:NAD(P)-dependent dehydrogenase (short-subunit alcohol dehydrogenase family)
VACQGTGVAVITRAASGMGREVARLFSAEGAGIVAADWHQAALDEVVGEVSAAGRGLDARARRPSGTDVVRQVAEDRGSGVVSGAVIPGRDPCVPSAVWRMASIRA